MEITEKFIQQVWERGIPFSTETQKEWRKDIFFAFIKRKDYNNFESDYGWGIEKIKRDEGNEISNFRPMQWRNIQNKLVFSSSEKHNYIKESTVSAAA